MKGFICILILISFALVLKVNAKDINVNQLLVPKFVKAQVVSDGMNLNGMDVTIIQFYTTEPFKKIEDFYRQEVREIKVSTFAEWQIISWIDNKKLNTVQVTYNELEKVHHGFIALSNLPAVFNKNVKLGKGFPSLKNSLIQNDIKATDLNKKSRTIWLKNNASVLGNINFYKKYYVNKGWQVQQVSVDAATGNGAMMLGKQGDEVNLAVTRTAGVSDVVVVEVKK